MILDITPKAADWSVPTHVYRCSRVLSSDSMPYVSWVLVRSFSNPANPKIKIGWQPPLKHPLTKNLETFHRKYSRLAYVSYDRFGYSSGRFARASISGHNNDVTSLCN